MHGFKDILYFVVVVVFFRFLFLNWLTTKIVELAERVTILLERWLVRNEREAVEWLHFKLKAQKQGHQARSVHDCLDGKCQPY